MSPRRLRSSLNLVVIIPKVGIGDPRWSRLAGRQVDVGRGGAPRSDTVVIPGPPVGS